ncbi:MAG TPA: hypothetical protein VFJ02_01435 [Vicinamibacterales bacterium]|nr:hypothetical protein [Vicinamibacterales bacterium]
MASVGLEYGFESEAAFSRAFQGEFGKPPAAWRKEQSGKRWSPRCTRTTR